MYHSISFNILSYSVFFIQTYYFKNILIIQYFIYHSILIFYYHSIRFTCSSNSVSFKNPLSHPILYHSTNHLLIQHCIIQNSLRSFNSCHSILSLFIHHTLSIHILMSYPQYNIHCLYSTISIDYVDTYLV